MNDINFTKSYIVIHLIGSVSGYLALQKITETYFQFYGNARDKTPGYSVFNLDDVIRRINKHSGFYVEFDTYPEAIDYVETLRHLEGE